MHLQIIKSKEILKHFPEFAPLFEIEAPNGNCKSCVRNAYNRRVKTAYEKILRDSGINEADVASYYKGGYGKPKITTKGIVTFANSLLKRAAATASGNDVLVDEKVYLKRLVACRNCPKLENGTCSVCTCPIHEKCKLVTESCPHPDGDKWKGIKA